MKNKDIVGDVWLYNREKAPDLIDWSKKENMPFLNPSKFIDSKKVVTPLSHSDQLELKWHMKQYESEQVDIYIRNELIAKIRIGSKPGWSILVTVDGPLAKKMEMVWAISAGL